jgi:hypothetical protein
MLFKVHILEAIRDGRVTLAFRCWRRPTVKAGGALRTPVGVVAIDAVDAVKPADITNAAAKQAGYPDAQALLAELRTREGTLYRVRLRFAGEDPRIALREQAKLTQAEREDLRLRLERMDARSRSGPWTRRVLGLIAANEGTRAAELAVQLDMDTLAFKRNVRKLKELGLTESLGTGYRLSPRGRALAEAWPTAGG